MSQPYIKALTPRRTIYALGRDNFPLTNAEVVKIVTDIVAHTPSSFNSQTTRAVVIFGKHHEKLWNEIAYNALKAVSHGDGWTATEQKLGAFAAAYGTVLFFEDTEIVKGMQEKFPSYADNFPVWAGHSTGAASIHVWTALALEKVGGNLQHYSPLIDHGVQQAWNVPSTWKLTGQLVFGSVVSPAKEPAKLTGTVKSFE